MKSHLKIKASVMIPRGSEVERRVFNCMQRKDTPALGTILFYENGRYAVLGQDWNGKEIIMPYDLKPRMPVFTVDSRGWKV